MKILRAAALAMACGLHASQAAESQRVYNFSPVNQYNLKVTAEFWNPIIEHVSERSGVKLALKLGRTSADTTSFVLAQEVDFAFTNHLFSPDRERMGWRVFGRRDAPPVHGQIVVPADSAIRTLEDLVDKEVAFPGPEALVAYKVTYAQLIRAGVPVKVVFGGNMDGAFSQLFSGRVAAAGANSQLVRSYIEREKKGFRVLWSSEPFNELALMASPRVPEKDRQAVGRVFLDMHNNPAGAEVLRRAAELVRLPEGVRFVAATEADYSAYRNFYRNAPAQLR